MIPCMGLDHGILPVLWRSREIVKLAYPIKEWPGGMRRYLLATIYRGIIQEANQSVAQHQVRGRLQ